MSADLVTETDKQCEAVIGKMIRERWPNHLIIGEENTAANGDKYDLTSQPTWVIDPIDGTTNFVHRNRDCCVLVGFCVDKEAIAGVCYNPHTEELFFASRGGGAFLAEGAEAVKGAVAEGTTGATGAAGAAGGGVRARRIHTSATADLGSAVVHLEGGYDRTPEGVAQLTTNLGSLLRGGMRAVRFTGSAGMNMVAVACGRADGYVERGPKIWDFCAGKVIVEEAGGSVVMPDGKQFDLLSRSIVVASTPGLAKVLCDTVTLG